MHVWPQPVEVGAGTHMHRRLKRKSISHSCEVNTWICSKYAF